MLPRQALPIRLERAAGSRADPGWWFAGNLCIAGGTTSLQSLVRRPFQFAFAKLDCSPSWPQVCVPPSTLGHRTEEPGRHVSASHKSPPGTMESSIVTSMRATNEKVGTWHNRKLWPIASIWRAMGRQSSSVGEARKWGRGSRSLHRYACISQAQTQAIKLVAVKCAVRRVAAQRLPDLRSTGQAQHGTRRPVKLEAR